MKHEIEIPDLPEGWEAVEAMIDPDGSYLGVDGNQYANAKIKLKKKQQRRDLYDPLRFAEGLIEQLPDDHEGAINWLMNNGDGEKADNLRKKYSHPQPRRIVLEETDIDAGLDWNDSIHLDDIIIQIYSAKSWKIVEDNKCAE